MQKRGIRKILLFGLSVVLIGNMMLSAEAAETVIQESQENIAQESVYLGLESGLTEETDDGQAENKSETAETDTKSEAARSDTEVESETAETGTDIGMVDAAEEDTEESMQQIFSDEAFTEEKDSVEAFVERLYELILGRGADAQGLSEWTKQLKSKANTGAEVVEGFIFSDEYIKRNVSNEEYVEILYRTCLNRQSDGKGKQEWVECLNMGFSKRYVLNGFVCSPEFQSICGSYDIESGSVKLYENRDKYENITRFVARCYIVYLGRYPDTAGLDSWIKVVINDPNEGQMLPIGFVFSNEVIDKNLSDEEFIKILYRGILDREADSSGLTSWVKRLRAGDSREKVCDGFIYSGEFEKLLAEYGLPFRHERAGLEELKQEITRSISKSQGNWSVYVKDLSSDEYLVINDSPMRAASVIKLFVMEAIYRQIETGSLEQTQTVTGLLNSMITVSSNEATNELVRRLGGGSDFKGAVMLNTYVNLQGYVNTHLGGALQPSSTPSYLYGGNTTMSAREAGELLEKIYRGENVSKRASQEMLQFLLRQQRKNKIPSVLPSGVKSANKTGENNLAQNDAAIVYSPGGDYIITVFCNNFRSSAAAINEIKEISSITYNYFNAG